MNRYPNAFFGMNVTITTGIPIPTLLGAFWFLSTNRTMEQSYSDFFTHPSALVNADGYPYCTHYNKMFPCLCPKDFSRSMVIIRRGLDIFGMFFSTRTTFVGRFITSNKTRFETDSNRKNGHLLCRSRVNRRLAASPCEAYLCTIYNCNFASLGEAAKLRHVYRIA